MLSTAQIMLNLNAEKINELAEIIRNRFRFPGLTWEQTLRSEKQLVSDLIEAEILAQIYVDKIDQAYPNSKAEGICFVATSRQSNIEKKYRVVVSLEKLLTLQSAIEEKTAAAGQEECVGDAVVPNNASMKDPEFFVPEIQPRAREEENLLKTNAHVSMY
jgi:hypothetical protein